MESLLPRLLALGPLGALIAPVVAIPIAVRIARHRRPASRLCLTRRCSTLFHRLGLVWYCRRDSPWPIWRLYCAGETPPTLAAALSAGACSAAERLRPIAPATPVSDPIRPHCAACRGAPVSGHSGRAPGRLHPPARPLFWRGLFSRQYRAPVQPWWRRRRNRGEQSGAGGLLHRQHLWRLDPLWGRSGGAANAMPVAMSRAPTACRPTPRPAPSTYRASPWPMAGTSPCLAAGIRAPRTSAPSCTPSTTAPASGSARCWGRITTPPTATICTFSCRQPRSADKAAP